MSESEKIRQSLARHGRKAYLRAKRDGNAYILVGNKLCRVEADGGREVIAVVESTRRHVGRRTIILE